MLLVFPPAVVNWTGANSKEARISCLLKAWYLSRFTPHGHMQRRGPKSALDAPLSHPNYTILEPKMNQSKILLLYLPQLSIDLQVPEIPRGSESRVPSSMAPIKSLC